MLSAQFFLGMGSSEIVEIVFLYFAESIDCVLLKQALGPKQRIKFVVGMHTFLAPVQAIREIVKLCYFLSLRPLFRLSSSAALLLLSEFSLVGPQVR